MCDFLERYRDWGLHCRNGQLGWECVVVSPYGKMTTAILGDGKEHVLETGKDIVDTIIENYYPDTPLGRYTPPTKYRPRPGQHHGLPFVAGRQVPSEAEARTHCQAAEPTS